MPRKLKVYQTSQGFFDLAVAAPTMKAALTAWGASPDLFRQGFASQSDDKEVIAAAMARPGVVLRRPVGTSKRFKEKAELPTAESLSAHFKKRAASHRKSAALKSAKGAEGAGNDSAGKVKSEETAKTAAKAERAEKAGRKAAAAFEKEERRRELQRERKEAAAARASTRRRRKMEDAKAILENARHAHARRIAAIEKDRAAVDRRAKEEEASWHKLKARLEAALQEASQ